MKNLFRHWRGLAGVIAITTSTLGAADVVPQVKTLGGGPNQFSPSRAGSVNGDTFSVAKFNNPAAAATDTNGNLYIADRSNNRVRKVSKVGSAESLTSTFASKLPGPVGIAVDNEGKVFVVTTSDGRLRVFNSGGTLVRTVSGLSRPTALALDADGNAYVTEQRGALKQITLDGDIFVLAVGFLKPAGVAVLPNGHVAVSECGAHSIYSVDPNDGSTTLLAGQRNVPGFNDGPGETAQFNQPCTLAVAPNGALVVADRGNHRIRVISSSGVVSTLYGVSRRDWSRSFAGWVDGEGGSSGVAAAREPLGVAVAKNGTVYATETYWDILREVTSTGLQAPTSTTVTNGTNVTIVLPTPTFSPTYGYYPFGVTVSVWSTNQVYYTTDGSEPTTNSQRVASSGGFGTLFFGEGQRDLSALRLKAITSSGSSPTVSGTLPSHNEIGIPRDFIGGSGSKVMIPVVANLRPTARVQSFQYRVEVSPLDGAPPILPYLDAVSILTNDFVPLVTAAAPGKAAQFTVSPYSIGTTRGLVVTASGTNANVDFEKFAATALLRVPIPPNATTGQRYQLQVLYPSATSNGYQGDITLAAGPSRTLTVGSLPWLVGDASPGFGYNAGEFGNGDLVNSDANSVLYASVGLRRPFPETDVFNAMDAFPPETIGGDPEGDREIDYNDWQVVLERSLRLDPYNWLRRWMDGGYLESEPYGSLSKAAATSGSRAKSGSLPAPGDIWTRGATLVAGNVYNATAGECLVPVSIKVAPGQSVAGMCFRVIVEPVGGSPAPLAVTFDHMIGASAFQLLPGSAPNDLVVSWTMVPSPAFHLTGQALVGRVRFQIPNAAGPGSRYIVRIVRPSGASDMQHKVSFEAIPGSVWAYQTPAQPAERTSEEWREYFFGPTNSPAADQLADPDEDGVANWQEYIDGTSPVDAGSYLRLEQTADAGGMRLSWLSAPAKLYTIERGGSASGPWQPLAVNIAGDGYVKHVIDYAPSGAAPFYRVRVQP